MNNFKLENVLKNESVDVLQKIFDSMSEKLSEIDKLDKVNLEKVNIKMENKIKRLKQEFKEIDSFKKEKISNELSEYINARDYIYAYYNEKYFKERSKNRNKTYDRNYEIIIKKRVKFKENTRFFGAKTCISNCYTEKKMYNR